MTSEDLQSLPEPARKAVLEAIGAAPLFGPGWTVCIRDGTGRDLACRFQLGNHEQVSLLALALARLGYFMTVETPEDCDFVFEVEGRA